MENVLLDRADAEGGTSHPRIGFWEEAAIGYGERGCLREELLNVQKRDWGERVLEIRELRGRAAYDWQHGILAEEQAAEECAGVV